MLVFRVVVVVGVVQMSLSWVEGNSLFVSQVPAENALLPQRMRWTRMELSQGSYSWIAWYLPPWSLRNGSLVIHASRSNDWQLGDEKTCHPARLPEVCIHGR